MNIKWLAIICGMSLVLGIPSFWPYSYYIALRWTVFISAIIVAHTFYKSGQTGWVLALGSIAFLFNPIVPIHLNKNSWVAIDLISAIAFFVSSNSINEKNI